MVSPSPRGHIPALDGVRACAALAVIGLHVAKSVLPGGYIGVDIFFVLSGFLITSLLVREADETRALDLPRFYVRRALRLLPALAALCAVQALVLAALPAARLRGPDLEGLATAATYTSSFFAAAGANLGWFTHTWSLSDEEVFYLAWPVVILLLRGSRHLAPVVFAITGAAIGWHLVVALASGVDRVYYPPDMRAEQLLIGCSLAVAVSRYRIQVPATAGGVAAAGLLAFGLGAGHLALMTYLRGWTTLIAVASAVLVGAVATGNGTWLNRLFAGPPQLWLGRRSYGLYLWHPLALLLVITYGPGSAMLRLPIVLLLSVAMAAASYRFVEAPFLRRKDALERHRARPVAAPVVAAQVESQ